MKTVDSKLYTQNTSSDMSKRSGDVSRSPEAIIQQNCSTDIIASASVESHAPAALPRPTHGQEALGLFSNRNAKVPIDVECQSGRHVSGIRTIVTATSARAEDVPLRARTSGIFFVSTILKDSANAHPDKDRVAEFESPNKPPKYKLRVDITLVADATEEMLRAVRLILLGAGLQEVNPNSWRTAGYDIRQTSEMLTEVVEEFECLDDKTKDCLDKLQILLQLEEVTGEETISVSPVVAYKPSRSVSK